MIDTISLPTPKILLVDDNKSIHQDYLKILDPSYSRDPTLSAAEAALFGDEVAATNRKIYNIDSAYQGEEGVTMVKQSLESQTPYAMAFVDIRMPPGIDGIETSQKLWQHDPDIQIVICTAYSDYSWDETIEKLGNTDRLVILKKPFDSSEVLQLAGAMTEKWRLLQQTRTTKKHMKDTIAERTKKLILAASQQKRQIKQIKRLNRFHSLVSNINSLIVRTREKQELFDQVCKITVQEGKFSFARISTLDGDQALSPVAHYSSNIDAKGVSAVVLNADKVTLDFDSENQHATICNDIKTHRRIPPWCDMALQSGFTSYAVIPLVIEGTVVGCIELYSSYAGAFDDEVVSLLKEIANNIAYAMLFILRKQESDYIASYDPLTGLANTVLFSERTGQFLKAAHQHKRKMAMIMIDIDNFKLINDSIGHSAGDTLLLKFSDTLSKAIGDKKSVARISADRFAALILLKENDSTIEENISEIINGCLTQAITIQNRTVNFTCKAGVAVFPQNGDTEISLIRNVESALKTAKRLNEKVVFFTEKIGKEFSQKLILEEQLHKALENNEFILHYQPKIELISGKICGAEALIRWNHPDNGLMMPDTFLPILESSDLIVGVGSWVMAEAARKHQKWSKAGLSVPRIAVNVSPAQMARPDFVDTVRSKTIITDDDTPAIDLEITESTLMQDIESIIVKLTAIRDMGIVIGVDDFGTGYSSLSYLARLPIGAVKIDRSFIVEMTNCADTMSIVSAIIALAHSMRLKVIAEGVDSEEQFKFLRLLKCDQIQGYLFSKPLSERDFVTALKENRTYNI
ncbi:MAG: EAL domain-containing protein [Zhongshania sp.]|nr:EAL domain-containing protein [Zhongshania sp.]